MTFILWIPKDVVLMLEGTRMQEFMYAKSRDTAIIFIKKIEF